VNKASITIDAAGEKKRILAHVKPATVLSSKDLPLNQYHPKTTDHFHARVIADR
jgi:hypothetical protein